MSAVDFRAVASQLAAAALSAGMADVSVGDSGGGVWGCAWTVPATGARWWGVADEFSDRPGAVLALDVDADDEDGTSFPTITAAIAASCISRVE